MEINSVKKKNCKVDIVSVNTKYTEDSKENITFEDLITDKEVDGKEFYIKGKNINFSILENKKDYIIGFLTSSIDKDLPAKINNNTKKISALDVTTEESLVFGSIFLYSKILNTMFYEINRDTVFLDGFKDFIYECYNKSSNLKNRTTFDLKFATIFRKNEYQRALDMVIYKKFRVKIHQPTKLLRELKEIKSSLEKKIDIELLSEIEKASSLNSDFAEIVFDVNKPKLEGGLSIHGIRSMIKNLKGYLKHTQIREKIDTIEIKGYSQEEDKVITPIDLIGDVYLSKFILEVPILNKNLQKSDRKEKILEVYEKEFEILRSFI
ncbi:conserved hypothetical protein [Tenacibaculum dicentrarchi]|nr:conserved hypothetical protein [Tenacibaculum dicentrarchi]